MKKKQLNHQVIALIVLVLSALLFVLLTMPFRLKLAGVLEITDMRPNADRPLYCFLFRHHRDSSVL